MKRVEFRENVRSFVPQGQSKLAVIMRCLYKVGVRKAGFDCTVVSDSHRCLSCFVNGRYQKTPLIMLKIR